MTDITQLGAPKAQRPTPQRMPARGVIKVPPDDIEAPTVRVVLPGNSNDYGKDCRWIRQGEMLPVAEAECLVVFDETGAGFVVWWAIAW